MSVAQTIETRTISVLQETAADVISIRRSAVKDPITGKVEILYSADVTYSTTQFSGTSSIDRDEVLSVTNRDGLNLTPEQVYSLFGISVTLADGTKTVLGELIAGKADGFIAQDVITKTKRGIKPIIMQNPSPAGSPLSLTNMNFRDAAVTYAWTSSDDKAVIVLQEDGKRADITEVTRPATITCTATDTPSGVTEATTFNLI